MKNKETIDANILTPAQASKLLKVAYDTLKAVENMLSGTAELKILKKIIRSLESAIQNIGSLQAKLKNCHTRTSLATGIKTVASFDLELLISEMKKAITNSLDSVHNIENYIQLLQENKIYSSTYKIVQKSPRKESTLLNQTLYIWVKKVGSAKNLIRILRRYPEFIPQQLYLPLNNDDEAGNEQMIYKRIDRYKKKGIPTFVRNLARTDV